MSAGEYRFLFSVRDFAQVPAPHGVATVRQQRRGTGTAAMCFPTTPIPAEPLIPAELRKKRSSSDLPARTFGGPGVKPISIPASRRFGKGE